MNEQQARSLFMDYLYDEISENQKEKLEKFLEKHPDLKEELSALGETRSVLQNMPEPDPAEKMLVVEPRERSFADWWQDAKNLLPRSSFGKTAFAAAAAILLFLFAGSLAQLQISTSGNGMTVSFGNVAPANKGLTADQADALVQEIREENAAMLADYAESIQRQNQEQLQQVVTHFEEQRMNDLQLVSQAIDELQQNTNYRLYQTNEYLSEVLQTVSYQNRNE